MDTESLTPTAVAVMATVIVEPVMLVALGRNCNTEREPPAGG